MRTLIIRLFSPAGEHVSRLQGLVQQPGRHAVRFLGADQLVEAIRTLGGAGDVPDDAHRGGAGGADGAEGAAEEAASPH